MNTKNINITSEMIKKLRKITGSGILLCKNALIESKGDIQLAIDNMRKTGHIKAFQKSNCFTKSGLIFIKTNQDNTCGAMVEVNCETDFVTKTLDFVNFGENIVNFILENNKIDLKILKQYFNNKRENLISKIDENIEISRFHCMKGNIITKYNHQGRIGAMVSTTTIKKENNCNLLLLKEIAMHIVANNPLYLSRQLVPDNIIQKEYSIQLELVKQSKNPQDKWKIIIENNMTKFLNDIVLLNNKFLTSLHKTVSEIIIENNIIIEDFIRFELGKML